MSEETFVSHRVESLLTKLAKVQSHLSPPIDPAKLAQYCGVLRVEQRPMIPEGVLAPVQGGFHIYLQSNFNDQTGVRLRQRFTLAHELVHTFYYDVNEPVPKQKKGAPRGQKLERLCHLGASQILVPEGLIRKEIRSRGEIASVGMLLDFTKMFDVSPEVLIRRLHTLELTADDKFAAILVNVNDQGEALIEAACYGRLLLSYTPRPERGLAFDEWVRYIQNRPPASNTSEWRHNTGSASILATKVCRSQRSFILGLRIEPLLATPPDNET